MYADLFDQFGAGGRLGRNAGGDSNTSAADEPLLSFKAGKMNLTPVDAQFDCQPDKTRGEVRLLWKEGALHWQWYNRRQHKVDDDLIVTPGTTWSRVEQAAATSRIYVWTQEGEHRMYWMQDADESKEEEQMMKLQEFLKDPSSAAPEGSAPSAPAAAAAVAEGGSGDAAQVDALSRILENLGMPQPEEGATTAAPAAAGGLTLSDLQGAMAGLNATPTPSLDAIVTQDAITAILSDEAASARLRELLPETQQDMLRENLQSPQLRQTLRSLSATIMQGNLPSVLANFQLPVEAASASANPLQAFLDAVMASVKEDKEEAKDDKDDDDDKMDEEKTDE